jgi:hypothetical protein
MNHTQTINDIESNIKSCNSKQSEMSIRKSISDLESNLLDDDDITPQYFNYIIGGLYLKINKIYK